jgi:hypothetical protein
MVPNAGATHRFIAKPSRNRHQHRLRQEKAPRPQRGSPIRSLSAGLMKRHRQQYEGSLKGIPLWVGQIAQRKAQILTDFCCCRLRIDSGAQLLDCLVIGLKGTQCVKEAVVLLGDLANSFSCRQ